jgi:hypothetical protein
VRVAKILKKHFKTSESAAVAEATNIAVTDGLYSEREPLIEYEASEDSIRLNVAGTFASASKADPELKKSTHTIALCSHSVAVCSRLSIRNCHTCTLPIERAEQKW